MNKFEPKLDTSKKTLMDIMCLDESKIDAIAEQPNFFEKTKEFVASDKVNLSQVFEEHIKCAKATFFGEDASNDVSKRECLVYMCGLMVGRVIAENEKGENG